MMLYNVFSEFLDDLSEDVLPNEATGFKQSKIWSMLYDFQKDAVLAIINKLEKYNGCILADSVGLGKTFTALAVIETKGNAAQLLAPAAKLPFMGSMLYLSLFSSILAFLCLNYAATILPVGKSTAFCNVTTVLSVFAGVVFLGEPVSVVSLIAAAVIIVGVFGVQKN